MKLFPIPAFSAYPTSAQFAKGGQWERAWTVDVKSISKQAELEQYLAGTSEVAFEVFFGAFFFGVRLMGDVDRVRGWATDCLNALKESKDGTLLTALGNQLGLPLTDSRPAYLELGCVNAWRSVGSTRFDCSDLSRAGFDASWRNARRTAVGRNTTHAKAVEFAYKHPLPHWIAIPVSAPRAPYALSKERLRFAFNLACLQDAAQAASVAPRTHGFDGDAP